MKKLLLGAAIAVSSLSFAQQFGAKAGVNIATVSGADNVKAKPGFNAGVFLNAPLAESFSIQPELLYSQYGYKNEYSALGGTYENKVDLGYIAVPVMFQYNVVPSFYLEAGPEFGFLVNAKNKQTVTSSIVNGTTTHDIKDGMNTFNIGIGLGAGYYFTPNIGVTARYVAGMNDSVKENSGDALKNNVFQAGLAFKF